VICVRLEIEGISLLCEWRILQSNGKNIATGLDTNHATEDVFQILNDWIIWDKELAFLV
jgi:hypothetical protein